MYPNEKFIKLLIGQISDTCHNYLGNPDISFSQVELEKNPIFVNQYHSLWIQSLTIIKRECILLQDSLKNEEINKEVFDRINPVLNMVSNIAIAKRTLLNNHPVIEKNVLYPLKKEDIQYIENYNIENIDYSKGNKVIDFIFNLIELSVLLMDKEWTNSLTISLPNDFHKQMEQGATLKDEIYVNYHISLIYLKIRSMTFYIYIYITDKIENESYENAKVFTEKINYLIKKTKDNISLNLEDINFLRSSAIS